jgi:hypothetical protein
MSSIGGFSFVYFLIWTVFIIASSSSIFIEGEGVIKRFCGIYLSLRYRLALCSFA